MKDFEVQARICPKCFDDHEADKECNVMDGMRCPNCGSLDTLALNLGDGYGDCFCTDCKKWCGFEEPPNNSI